MSNDYMIQHKFEEKPRSLPYIAQIISSNLGHYAECDGSFNPSSELDGLGYTVWITIGSVVVAGCNFVKVSSLVTAECLAIFHCLSRAV